MAFLESNRSYEFLHRSRIAGLDILFGSDQHIDTYDTDRFTEMVTETVIRSNPDLVIFGGDMYNSPYGEFTGRSVSHTTNYLARKWGGPTVNILGNHDFRAGGEDPGGRFLFFSNVISPLRPLTEPVHFKVRGVEIIAANIFYSNLIAPEVLGLTEAETKEAYAQSTDGKHLFDGRTDLFDVMADRTAAAFQKYPKSRIFLSHCLPHPSLLRLKVAAGEEVLKRRAIENHMGIMDFTSHELRRIETGRTTEQAISHSWRIRAVANMGSNVLNRPGFDPAPDGLQVILGHSHHSEYGVERTIAGRKWTFHQHAHPVWT